MLAAASVFLWQTTNRFIWLIGGGVVAVGLFFVLSGFVLARSLMFRNSRHRAWRLAYLGPFTDRAPRTSYPALD
jgi:peptidoglycan/LPS O-acetylase OafA/YrhL